MHRLHRFITLIFLGLVASSLFYVPVAHSAEPEAEEDALDEEATVESDEKPTTESDTTGNEEKALSEQDKPVEEEMPDGLPKPHPTIETNLLFTDPHGIGQVPRPSSIVPIEVPVHRPVHILVGCRHLGVGTGAKVDFTLDAIAAALRYPMDYSYYIQNFTASRLDQVIQPNEEISIAYAFIPAQQLSGRPYGLTVRVFYHDSDGQSYVSTVMNETVQLIEWEATTGGNRWIDTEAIFLYLVIAGITGLFLLGIYQLWQSYAPKSLRGSKKHGSSKWTSSSSSSNNHGQANKKKSDDDNGVYEDVAAAARAKGVDVDWIPREHLLRQATRRSPPQQSPRQRKVQRDAANHEESD